MIALVPVLYIEKFVDANKVTKSYNSKDRQNNVAKQQSLMYTDNKW